MSVPILRVISVHIIVLFSVRIPFLRNESTKKKTKKKPEVISQRYGETRMRQLVHITRQSANILLGKYSLERAITSITVWKTKLLDKFITISKLSVVYVLISQPII